MCGCVEMILSKLRRFAAPSRGVTLFTVASALLFGAPTSARAVQIAFLEILTPSGEPLQLVTGGRFAHIAISYHGLWLHAHPQGGVQFSRDLSAFGRVAEIWEAAEISDPQTWQVEQLLRLPYDWSYDWDARDRTYCSKLVGRLLGLSPEPMAFDAPIWKNMSRVRDRAGAPGLSPDGIWLTLLRRPGWRRIFALIPEPCPELLTRHSQIQEAQKL